MEDFLTRNPLVIVLAALWTLPWKGISLWRAARAEQKKWFIALLIINTLGLLEILYIFVFGKKKKEIAAAKTPGGLTK